MKAKANLLWSALAAASLALAGHAFAASNQSDVKTTDMLNSYMDNRMDRLTQEEQSLARQWKLTDSDWEKYKEIMSGPRGVWSPGLDPITALGVHESDPVERRRYATIWMEMEIKRTELELAFEVERMNVSKRLLMGQKVVKNESWIEQWQRKQSAIQNEVMLFVDVGCTEKCEELFNEVAKSSTSGGNRLNVFFNAGATAEDIGKWAQGMGIDPQIVRDRYITLNFDEGQFAQFNIAQAELPEVRVKNVETGRVTETFTRY
mgnify:CR=1 FL=1